MMCAQLLLALAVLCRPDVRTAIDKLRAEAFQNRAGVRYEEALLVRGDATRGTLDWVAGTAEEVEFISETELAAVVHTHLDPGWEQPSREDIAAAKALGVPVVVVSRTAMWAAMADGTLTCVTAQSQ